MQRENRHHPDAEVSFEFGLLFAGATYYLLARQHPSLRWASPTERASTDTQAPFV